ncbi:hypothetical protein F4824DRAFT_470913 [Ustulina deusta]|nr:hypothetical protein F4824DRAFT_470913 [Ustulina deusta]
MFPIKHTAEERISTFFQKYCTASRATCDSIAEKIAASKLAPSSTQGAFSYTLIGADCVIQFRAQISALSLDVAQLARSIHGSLVPRVVNHGELIVGSNTIIYPLDRLPGETYSAPSAQSISFELIEKQRNTIKGLARIFAQALSNPQAVAPLTVVNTRQIYEHRLRQLTKSLPERYKSLLAYCTDGLSHMFGDQMPWTLTHGDLCDANLLVDRRNGELTGLVDWAEGSILPFGLALWGLETLLGFMDDTTNCWVYYECWEHLEDLFWQTLKPCMSRLSPDQLKGVHIARMLGLLCRHGFKFTGAGEISKDESWDLRLLDGQIFSRPFATQSEWINRCWRA